MSLPFPTLTPDEAAALVQDGQTVGFSGFTPAGAAKVVPKAIAARARVEHDAGRPFKIAVVTGASTGDSLDGELARADAISWRTPYQSNKALRDSINEGRTRFFDMHLSQLPQFVRGGVLGEFDWAIVEACDVTADGQIVLTTSVGASPTFLRMAKRVLIEINRTQTPRLCGFHDIYEPFDPPNRQPIPILRPSDRIGTPVVKIDPAKIAGIVESNVPDETGGFGASDQVTDEIGRNVAEFLAGEISRGRIPKQFLPIQSGVGNIANAVLGALGEHPGIPPFEMYSEVIQDSVIKLVREERIRFATGTSLTLGRESLKGFFDDLELFRPRILLRPQEITNNPEIVRRLGLISINTALEVDLFGNVNSTHVMGSDLMNGIGGSGDFTRNAFISIFTCPSIVKGGKISTIVPLVSHMDHSEHSVQVVVTENGFADLRGKSPGERAWLIAEKCAHPDFRRELMGYFYHVRNGHTPQTLAAAYAMHQHYLETGTMKDVPWASHFGMT